MSPRVVAPGGLKVGRAREIEKGQGAPPTEQEQAELARFSAWWKAKVAPQLTLELDLKNLKAASELQRRVSKLPPSQQRRYEKVRVREAPLYLRLLRPRTGTVHAPPRRQNTARPRERRGRRASTSSRASPGGLDPEPPLEVIPPARFRRELRRALGGAA
jgi:hypothetical protein